jgi:hypothetical protein
VPEISRFFGIVITMYQGDHVPPHFHARYGEQSAAIEISTSRVLEGWLAPRIRRLVAEWGARHRAALYADWQLVRADIAPLPIPPLE